jgi:hypothetical protein
MEGIQCNRLSGVAKDFESKDPGVVTIMIFCQGIWVKASRLGDSSIEPL